MVLWIYYVFLASMVGYAGMTLFSAWHFYFSHSPPPELVYPPSVTVIVPARDESSHIESCLLSILHQTYPTERLEVICVDDSSSDDTYKKANTLAQAYPQLTVIQLSQQAGEKTGKKAALQAGIEVAKGEFILQTDADCRVPPKWVSTIISYFEEGVGMVAGPVKLIYQPSLFQKLQALEIAGLGVLGGGAIMGRRPHMCNGGNLSFRKSLFEAIGGYQEIDHIASGDDELLLQKVLRLSRYSIAFCCSQEAIVTTAACRTWSAFTSQRIRWVSKAKHYTNRQINLLQITSYLAFLGLFIFLILFLINSSLWTFFLSLLLLKLLVDIPLMFQAVRFFREKPLLWLLPLLECAYIPYVLWVGIVGNFNRSYTWKNRTVS